MTDKSSEMSLDEVLSSIKEMVIDSNPPVLDLTDVVAPDGSISKTAAAKDHDHDISSFLKLVQRSNYKEDFDQHSAANAASETLQENKKSDKNGAVFELMKEIARPLVKQWIEENLPHMVGKAVEAEIKKLFGK